MVMVYNLEVGTESHTASQHKEDVYDSTTN